MPNELTRRPPALVARQLRQEAGFGCVVCGCPILEYHHIVEWSEQHHHDVKDMVAVCPTHHAEFGIQSQAKAYAAKANPFNIRRKQFRGLLRSSNSTRAFKLGCQTFWGGGSIFNYYGNRMFGYKVVDEEVLLDIFMPDVNFWPEVEIKANDAIADLGGLWDIDFHLNWVKFRRRKGDVFLSIDFRGEMVQVLGRFSVNGQAFDFSPSRNDYNGQITTGDGGIDMSEVPHLDLDAIRYGSGRIIRPNFAMTHPRPIVFHEST